MNCKKQLPSQEFLNECFNYNSITGVLLWKKRPRSHFLTDRGMKRTNSQFKGSVAGHLWVGKHNKYWVIKIKSVRYYAHRLIWKLFYGEDPNEVDHKNINSLDNSIENLKNTTPKENAKNKKIYANNKSGSKGVYKKGLKWVVQMRRDGKLKSFGSFDTFNEARDTSVKVFNGEMLC